MVRRSALNFMSQNAQILRAEEKLCELRQTFSDRNGFAVCLQETGRKQASEVLEHDDGFTYVFGG